MFLGSTRLETIQNLHSASVYFSKLKRVVKVVRPDNGLRERPKCLPNNTNRKVVVTVTNNFNIEDLLGLKCLVTIAHITKGDKTYANVGSVGGLPRGMAPFESSADEFCWSYDDAPRDGVPEWVQKAAANCIELTGLNNATVPAAAIPATKGHAVDPDDPNTPF